LADLHVGDVLKMTLHVKIHPAWLGALQNAAYVQPETDSADPSPEDQVATPVETEVVRRPDLVVNKSIDVAEVVAGAPVSYTVTVHNQGPSDAPEVRVQDLLAATLRSGSWTCSTQLGTGDCVNSSG